MPSMKFVYLTIAILAEVTATSFMTKSDGFTKLAPSVITVIGYVIAFYFLALSLREIPVGIAYAIWAGAGIVLIAAIGWLVYGQKLDLPAIIGIGMILGGVIIVNTLSKTAVH